MTVTVVNIIPAKHAESAQTTQYIAVGRKTVIDKATATNTSGSSVDFSVNLVTQGESPSATNLVVNARAIAPEETYPCPELVGQVIEPGGFISTLASASGAITIRFSGREIT